MSIEVQYEQHRALFITTKVSPENLRYNDVIASAKRSLKRLKTEYIDLYLIHVPNPRIPIQKTMETLNFLYKQELIKFIGVSNFSVKQIKEAHESSQNKIVTNQIEYSLLVRDLTLPINNSPSGIQYYTKFEIICNKF